jgi:hypothetical protein
MPPKPQCEPEAPGSSLRVALLVFASLTLFYLSSFGATFRVDDEHILAARAQSLALWGNLEEPQVYGNLRVRQLSAFGDQATQVEPAQAVLGAVLYRLGMALGGGGVQALFTLNLLATAGTAAVVFRTVLRLGWNRTTAVWCAMLFGLGTMAWPYSTTFYRDSLAMLASSLCFLAWAYVLTGQRTGRWLGICGVGAAIVAGMLAKNTSSVLIPVFGVTGLAIGLARFRASNSARRWLLAGVTALGLGLLLLRAIPETGPLARYSMEYLGFLVQHAWGSLGPELLPSIAGPFLSPSKSLFLFSPPLIVTLLSIRQAWRAEWRFALPALLFPLGLAVLQALFYQELWAGVYGWGLRFMLPALPGLIVISAPLVEAMARSPNRAFRLGLWLCLVSGAVIQAGATWVPWIGQYLAWKAEGLNPYAAAAAWDARFMAIPGQLLRLARPQMWHLAWLRMLRGGSAEAAGLALAGLVLAAGGLALLLRETRRIIGRPARALTYAVFVTSLILPLWPNLSLLRADPAWSGDRREFQLALQWLRPRVASGDCVVLASYGTSLWSFWMNWWDQPVRWYSLPYEIPGSSSSFRPGESPSEAVMELLHGPSCRGRRIWYMISTDTPGYGLRSERERFSAIGPSIEAATFEGPSRVEIYLYSPAD